MKFIFYLLSLLIFISIGCDKGIEPEPESIHSEGFGGTITFIGEWNDDVMRTHIVAFDSLLEAANDFSALNLQFVSLEIPFGTTEYNYSTLDSAFLPVEGNLEAGVYEYVAVVQSETEELSLDRKDWTVAGIYYADGDTTKPGTVIIPENTFVDNINILCDFNNPPPQPPGGN